MQCESSESGSATECHFQERWQLKTLSRELWQINAKWYNKIICDDPSSREQTVVWRRKMPPQWRNMCLRTFTQHLLIANSSVWWNQHPVPCTVNGSFDIAHLTKLVSRMIESGRLEQRGKRFNISKGRIRTTSPAIAMLDNARKAKESNMTFWLYSPDSMV